MDEVVKQRRNQLTECIRTGTDPLESIHGLIQINCPLREKFVMIKGFSELLIKNSETSEGLRQLMMMFNILEKYGRHLLKPTDQRSSMWRHIKNSNAIYRDRVARIWGGPLIMKMMGYTEDRGDGVAFPEGSEPNHAKILELVGDIILGRKELELYLARSHPYPQLVEEHLNPNLLSVLKQGASDTGDRNQQPKPSTAGTQSLLPTTLGSLRNNSGSPKQQSLENKINPAQQTDMETQNENRAQSIVCDICGKNQADIICAICDNKQLCGDCDTKWHSHPKRQNHNRQTLGQPLGPGSTLGPQTQGQGSTPVPQPCGGVGAGVQQGQQLHQQKRIVLGELPQGEGGNMYSPPSQQHTPPPLSNNQHIYQTLIRPGTGPSMLYEPMMYGQLPSSSSAHIPTSEPHSSLMYQPQYPPQHIPNQPRLVQAMWPSSQPGSGQYYNPNQMLGTAQSPRSNQMSGDKHMTGLSHVSGQGHVIGQSHIQVAYPRTGQSMQYPYSLAGGLRANQEVHDTFPSGYHADMNQSHTIAYYPASYAGSSPSPQSTDPLSMPRYQAPSPQGQGDPGFHSNQIRPGSPAVFQNKCQGNDDTYETPIKSDNSLKRSNLHLIQKLQSIPNLEKRRSRLDINVATLKEEIEELDKRINKIIVENENFIGDHEYKRLSKRKQKFLRDIQELEKYEQELDRMINENVHEDLTNKEIIVQKLPGDANIQLQGPPNIGQSPGSVRFPPNTTITPDVIGGHPNILTNQKRESNYMQGGQAIGGSANQKLPGNNSANEEEENFRNAEEERKMNEIRKMLLLSQNPFGPKPSKQEQLGLNIPVSEGFQQKPLPGEGVSYPPQIVVSSSSDIQAKQKFEDFTKMMHKALDEHSGLEHKASVPNLKVTGDESKTIRKVSSDSDIQHWQCEHCTFVNEHSSNVCSVCYKTNDIKKIIKMGLKEKELDEASAFGGGDMSGASGQGNEYSGVKPCKKCTFHNKPGQEKCEMCGEALILVTAPLKVDVVGGGEKASLEVANKPGSGENKKEAVSPRVTSLEQKLEEEQDQVFYEKKLAQQKFKELQQTTYKRDIPPQTSQNLGQNKSDKTPNTGIDESSFVFVDPGSSLLLTEGVPLEAGYIGPKKVLNKKLASLQKTPQGSPPSSNEDFFITPPASMMEMGPAAAGGQVIDRRPPANVNFNEAIEQIQMRKAQEQMSIDGHEYVMLLKTAEKEKYTMDEVEIAVTHCVDDKMKPIDWLKKKWVEHIDAVIDMATQLANQNDDVGELSNAEAKEELIKSKGDIKKAAEACVKTRKEKFKEISSEDEYLGETILTALYQNKGNVEETIKQLNSYIIKGISDHVWVEPSAASGGGAVRPGKTMVRAEGGAQGLPLVGAGAGAVGAQGSEVSDGSAGSIIADEGFQELIKNKEINRERRIRTILVEAKLQSWGRAETVIIILDTETHELDDILDCSLDDIIEAVKNCGDRKRSLAYLRQECGICFSCYPMNKIQTLNSCECKLCRYCLKQNFEVAIREKYVRNWGCPLCQAPNLEDELAAQSYFEFLQMLLRTLVDDEIKDLFETKLRDWHLQKEVNFRWCAHCASGFVWDRPNVMGMTCPSCNKKTCFMCKKKWEDQHQGLTCEEFTQWKIDNDPNFQAVGLARHLEENGIDCPSCKMRYDLAKGGCMHFRCPQCGHEFCSGCSEPFMQDGACKLLKECKGKGLHCHHPRDCFYYLRDNDVAHLQALMKQGKVEFNTEIPPTQKDPRHCPVMEQKEYGINKKDEACGKDTEKGMAGLCLSHYKEYMVGLINKNKLDPVDIMGVKELDRCFVRMGRQAPKLNKNENEGQYRQRLAKLVRESFPLRR